MLHSLKSRLIALKDLVSYKKSFSQDGEDMALQAWFEGKKGYKGFFVDVGAHHPARFSNTLFFYKKGWRGINIDPTPGSMRLFNLLRGRDVNLEIGISSSTGILKFFCFNDPALNTFDVQLAEQRNTGKPYFVEKTVDVPLSPLSEVLKKHVPKGQKIDFISIDVEGLDLMVLQSNDWDNYAPDFVLVEDVKFSIEDPTNSEIYLYLQAKGYKIVAALRRTIIFQRS